LIYMALWSSQVSDLSTRLNGKISKDSRSSKLTMAKLFGSSKIFRLPMEKLLLSTM
jgi:hypothetical protein